MDGVDRAIGLAKVLIATKARNNGVEWSEALRNASHATYTCSEEDSLGVLLSQAAQLRVIVLESPFFAGNDVESLRDWVQKRSGDLGSLMIFPGSDRQGFRAALDAGIDMPLLAPVSTDEIQSAVTALLKRLDGARSGLASEPQIFQHWVCDSVSWRIYAPGSLYPAQLSYREVEFILRLAQTPGVPVRREEFSYLFGISVELFDPRRLEVMVRRMRKNILAETGQNLPLLTAHGIGYAMGTLVQVVTSLPHSAPPELPEAS